MSNRSKSSEGVNSFVSRISRFFSARPALARTLILLLPLAAGVALFPPSFGLETMRIREGDRAPRTVVAQFEFPVLKEPGALEQERTESALRSPIALIRDDSVTARVFSDLGNFRSMIQSLRSGYAYEAQEPEMELSQALLVWLMLTEDPTPLVDQVESVLQEGLDRGLVGQQVEVLLREADQIQVGDTEGSRITGVDQIQTPTGLREDARNRALARNLDPVPFEELVMRFSRPNLLFDVQVTDEIRQAAREGIDPVLLRVQRGERIVEARQRVTPEILKKLESYDEWRRKREMNSFWEQVGGLLGRFLLLCVGVGSFVAYVRFLRQDLYRNLSDLTLLSITAALVMGLSGLLLHLLNLSPLMAPIAAAPILISLLYDERLALVVGLGLTGLVGLIADAGAGVIAVLGAGAVTSVFCVRGLRQRKQFYRLVLFVPAVHLITLVGLVLAYGQTMNHLVRDGVAAIANPILSVGLALFIVPLAEHGFRKCSDITLLEFSDLNRPLLRRMMVEAPGTYHHCLMVGTLAEAGARVGGGNPLLARVIGYYHDIGKLSKPDYFIENIPAGRKNPHDRLTPSMSRLILESHVREGVALAKGERLPHIVVEGVRQHHGGSLMTFFWLKAKRMDPSTQESDFRYPGPGPGFREAALVMLADQIDAASRALEDPTPSRIKGVVKKVIETRLGEGNLDESELTLSDLARIRDAFVPILAAFFHGRTAYVAPEEDAAKSAPPRDRESVQRTTTS